MMEEGVANLVFQVWLQACEYQACKYLSCLCSFNIELSLYKNRFFNSPTPLLLGSYPDILRIRVVSTFHVTALASNYVSSSINFHSPRIPWINTFQVINNNCDLVIFQNISVFCRFKKVHSTYIKIFTIKIKTNRYNIMLYGSFLVCRDCSCSYSCKPPRLEVLFYFLRKYRVSHCHYNIT